MLFSQALASIALRQPVAREFPKPAMVSFFQRPVGGAAHRFPNPPKDLPRVCRHRVVEVFRYQRLENEHDAGRGGGQAFPRPSIWYPPCACRHRVFLVFRFESLKARCRSCRFLSNLPQGLLPRTCQHAFFRGVQRCSARKCDAGAAQAGSRSFGRHDNLAWSGGRTCIQYVPARARILKRASHCNSASSCSGA